MRPLRSTTARSKKAPARLAPSLQCTAAPASVSREVCPCCGNVYVWLKWSSSYQVTQSCMAIVDKYRALYGEPKFFTVHTEKP